MLRVSAINQRLPAGSAREARLGQINLALATLETKRQDQLRDAEADLARLENELATARGNTLVDVLPFINALRQYVSVAPDQPLAVPDIPADVEDTMEALGLDDGAIAGVVGSINRVSRDDIFAFLRGPGAGQTTEDYLDGVDAAGNRVTTLQKIAQISGVGAGADTIPVNTDRTTAALNLYLQDKQTPVTTDEADFLNWMRQLITAIDALKVIQTTRTGTSRELGSAIRAWNERGDDYDRGDARVRQLREEIARGQQNVDFLRQSLKPGAQNEELAKVRANLETLRAEISNVDIADRRVQDIPGLRARLILAREEASRDNPEDFPDMAVVEAQAGDMLEFSFEVDSTADEIRISAETFDLPMSAQLRREVPGALDGGADFIPELRRARERIQYLNRYDDQLGRVRALLNALPNVSEDTFDNVLEQAEVLVVTNFLTPNEITQLGTLGDPLQEAVENLPDEDEFDYQDELNAIKPDLLAFIDQVRVFVAASTQRFQNQYFTQAEARDSTGWWLAHRLAYIQVQRDNGLVYKVYVNNEFRGNMGVSAPEALIPAATTLTGPGKGTYTIRARATSAHTGPTLFTLKSYATRTNAAGDVEATEIDEVVVPVRIRVKERCIRSGKSVVALEQEEFGKCVFSIGPTSWEKGRLNELQRQITTAQGDVERLERERDRAAILGPGLVSADERQLRILNAQDAVSALESEANNINDRIRRRQGTLFRGYYCASSLLLSPPSPLTPLKRPDEVARFDYSAITGPEYSARDLIFFQRTQAIGLGARAPVELPVTADKLALFDPRDPAPRAYLLGDYNPGATTSFLTGQDRQTVVDFPGRALPITPAPFRTKITLDLPKPSRTATPRFTIKPSSLSPVAQGSAAPAPERVEDEEYEYYTDNDEPEPVRAPAVDPKILKGETEVFESAPEPKPRAATPTKLEREFKMAIEAPLDRYIPVPRNTDGTVALGVPFMRFVEHMSKLEQRTAQLETDLMKTL